MNHLKTFEELNLFKIFNLLKSGKVDDAMNDIKDNIISKLDRPLLTKCLDDYITAYFRSKFNHFDRPNDLDHLDIKKEFDLYMLTLIDVITNNKNPQGSLLNRKSKELQININLEFIKIIENHKDDLKKILELKLNSYYYELEINYIDDQVSELEDEISELDDMEEEELKEIEEQEYELEDEIDNLNEEIENYNSYIDDNKQEIEDLEENLKIAIEDEDKDLEEIKRDTEEEIKNLKNEIEDYKSQIKEAEDRIIVLNRELSELRDIKNLDKSDIESRYNSERSQISAKIKNLEDDKISIVKYDNLSNKRYLDFKSNKIELMIDDLCDSILSKLQ